MWHSATFRRFVIDVRAISRLSVFIGLSPASRGPMAMTHKDQKA